MTKKEGPGSSGGSKNPHLLSSVVGSPSSSSLSSASSKKHQQQKSARSMLYHPSIFRYTCTGRLSLDSRNGGNRTASSGICHGIQSNLEHIDHWRLSTRDDAIKHFEYASAMGSSGGSGENSSSSSDQEGGGGTATAQAQQAVYLSNVLLYPLDDDNNTPVLGDDNDNNDDDDEKDNKKKKKKKKEMIDISRKNTDGCTTITPQQETWSCYGSTEIDLLVLRPQNEKEESIACVSSYCAPGMTVRDLAVNNINNVGTTGTGTAVEDGTRERTTTIRLGILEIVYATTVEGDNDNNTTNNINKRIGSKDKDQVGEEDKDTTTFGGSGGIFGGLATTVPDKVIHSSKNIVKHMKINGQLLYQSVQENYPTRTYEASQRITNEFSNTFHRTTKLMKKVYNYIADEEDDYE